MIGVGFHFVTNMTNHGENPISAPLSPQFYNFPSVPVNFTAEFLLLPIEVLYEDNGPAWC